MGSGTKRAGARHRLAAFALAILASLLVPAVALAHLERPSYWPDPTPDNSVSPPAGGEVPTARTLGSALKAQSRGDTRVVCKGPHGRKSLYRLGRSIRKARKHGYRLRPSQPRQQLTRKRAGHLRQINRKLARKCRFHSVQKAIFKSRNNDRVVIMPGRYTEPHSRKQPVNDPKCNPSMLQENASGALTPSYEYQAKCPNDQNLIHVAGRAVKGHPAPVRPDRHGIPEEELGRCIRCNLQIDGTGVIPEDVILDAGKGYEHPMNPDARPGGDRPAAECHPADEEAPNPCYAKHVVLRADRADGLVARNFLMRGGKEFGFYTEESDGVLLDRVKFFWNADYGHLSFTSDHNVVKNCDGYGSGDSVVYPGAAPQTGEFRDESFYPKRRYNTVIKRCDLHGSAMGYSGSMGNSVRVTHNRFYGNANGLTSDTLSAPGHPGFPADGMKIDHNWFYSNNLDIYTEDPEFEPFVPQAVGSAIIWAGYNDGTFSHNWVFDNWRNGPMLFATPDAVVQAVSGSPEGNVDPQFHCPSPPGKQPVSSTSCDNQFYANHMGQVPPSFHKHPGLGKFGNKSSLLGGGPVPAQLPNGSGGDFWWDQYSGNVGDCWYDNTGPDGTRDSLTSDPPPSPVPNTSPPGFLPENCTTSVGTGNPAKEAMLLTCFGQYESGQWDLPACDWFDTPPRPGTASAEAAHKRTQREQARFRKTPQAKAIQDALKNLSGGGYGPEG